MVPALAFFLAARAVVEGRRDALLSFDADAARGVFARLGTAPLTNEAWRGWVRSVVSPALVRYPATGLVARIDAVYVVWTLWFDGTSMGGTNDRERRIVLALGPGAVDSTWLERAVHHEIAHVVRERRRSGFPNQEWIRANAPGFRYGKGGFDAVRAGQVSKAFDAALSTQGVLSVYGASSIDEDWCTIAESVMVDDPAFWAFAARYPRLRAKAQLAVEFYRRTFPGIRLREVGAAER